MKKFAPLAFGLLLLLAIPRASAETQRGISEYVQHVLERATRAEAEISTGGGGGSGGADLIKGLGDMSLTTIAGALDPKVMRSLTESNFAEATPCFVADEALIQAEMVHVVSLIDTAIKEKNTGKAARRICLAANAR